MTNAPVPNVSNTVATGGFGNSVFIDIYETRDPNSNDYQYQLQQKWLNTSTGTYFILKSFSSAGGVITANWISIGGSSASETFTCDTGIAVPVANNINLLGSGSTTTVGSGANATVQLQGLTNHNVLVGAGTTTITKVAPSATAGVPLVSSGAAADPAFGTAVVPGGGTGNTSMTAYAVVCGGTTSTANLQSVASVGTSGQILTSNGAGALPTFQAPATFSSINVQVFTSSGTYTPTSGMKYCVIECLGGGGGGGGAAITAANEFATGGGGGGGGYARVAASAATIGASKTVTIGSGGAGGTGAAQGSTGGTTSLGTLCVATGGTGGSFVSPINSALSTCIGGNGGIGTTGSVMAAGGCGAAGFGSSVTQGTIGGAGGSSVYGGGGQATGSANTPGIIGQNYGGGGSGASAVNNNGSNRTGGAGTSGLVIVTEYI